MVKPDVMENGKQRGHSIDFSKTRAESHLSGT